MDWVVDKEKWFVLVCRRLNNPVLHRCSYWLEHAKTLLVDSVVTDNTQDIASTSLNLNSSVAYDLVHEFRLESVAGQEFDQKAFACKQTLGHDAEEGGRQLVLVFCIDCIPEDLASCEQS